MQLQLSAETKLFVAAAAMAVANAGLPVDEADVRAAASSKPGSAGDAMRVMGRAWIEDEWMEEDMASEAEAWMTWVRETPMMTIASRVPALSILL